MRRALYLKLGVLLLAAMAGVTLAALLARGRPNVVLAVAVICALGALVAAGVLVRSVARPMKDLSAAFRRVGAGDLETRVLPARRGELKELGDGFNEMVFRTKTMVAELREGREALDAIIGSMKEGLLVIDADGRVVLANRSCCAILGAENVSGRFYWEVVREPELVELLKSAPVAGPVAGRTELAGRVYESSAVHLPTSGRTVLTLYDVTAIAEAARLKRDLVTSVSHELRTPLTAIKGYVETLEEKARPEDRRHLETIHRNTDRLISLVSDLLTLSELEETGSRLQLENIDVADLAAAAARTFERRAEEKGLALRLHAEPGSARVRADAFKLEQVLVNLLDNAVKYTETGEVELRVVPGQKVVRIQVADTGPGISREHLPRIFERFYVVDKSRSRQLGGTGLGLAIAKHIVQLHSGDITVESTPGVGTTFTLTLPAA